MQEAQNQTGISRAVCIQLQMLKLPLPAQIHLAANVGGGHPPGRRGFPVAEGGAARGSGAHEAALPQHAAGARQPKRSAAH